MKQVDFYLIENSVADAQHKLASRLAKKLQGNGLSTLIVTTDENSSERLDQTLWAFSDTSFVAHDRLGAQAQTARSSTHITEIEQVQPDTLEHDYAVLINLSENVPVFSHHFNRIAEIIELDDTARAQARQRYRDYQAEGFTLKTHNIQL